MDDFEKNRTSNLQLIRNIVWNCVCL